MNKKTDDILSKFNQIFFLVIAIFLLYIFSHSNYLLFHIIAEGFSIIISFMIFLIAYHSRHNTDDQNLTFLGYSYFFIGFLDFLHTLSYKGMNILTDYQFYANQLWVVARFMESISLLVFISLYFLNVKNIRTSLVFYTYSIITSISILTIFKWKIFPLCFIEGHGQTTFKIISEYIIIIILFAALILLIKKKFLFSKKIFSYILFSIITTILSEFCFTLYISNYGLSNIIGHIFKFLSFFFVYRSLIVTGIEKPYNLLYNKLKQNEESLLESNKTKDKFFSIIAHDLKNPFNSILGFTDLILNNYKDLSDADILKFTQLTADSANNAYKLLENLLHWSRFQMGRIKFSTEKINLYDVIQDNIDLTISNAKLKNININYFSDEKDIFIDADNDMISLIIRNLLSNAIKFTQEMGTIDIKLAQTTDKVFLSIKDNGIGMPQDIIDNLFNIASQTSRKGTNNETGSGLGLILCNEFILKHKGSISVESKENLGSKFTIILPNYPDSI